MGQRHQLYYKIKCYENGDKSKMVSYHSQWCYGSLPLWRVKWLLEYNKKADKYNKLGGKDCLRDTADIIRPLITANASNGFYSYVHDITDETIINDGRYEGLHDPRRGDNNDGITVMDFTVKSKPAYAFVTIFDDEPTYLEPLTARDYALLYYKETDAQWKNYGVPKLVRYIDRHARLLTVEELEALFPTMYEEFSSERMLLKNADPKRLPLLLATNDIQFKSNKKFAETLLKGEAA